MLEHLALKELMKSTNNLYYGIATQKDVAKLILGYSIIADKIIVTKEASASDVKYCIVFKKCLNQYIKDQLIEVEVLKVCGSVLLLQDKSTVILN